MITFKAINISYFARLTACLVGFYCSCALVAQPIQDARPGITDQDNDGFLEISYLEQLYAIRGETELRLELTRDLDFYEAGSYYAGEVNAEWLPQDSNGNPLVTPTPTDIALSTNRGWDPLSVFNVRFNGNGFTISNLYATAGLFYELDDSDIYNLVVEDAYVFGGTSVGVIASISSGEVYNCHVSGTVAGGNQVGGIVGYNSGSISGCSFSGDVRGNVAVGGIVGYTFRSIDNNYSIGTVVANEMGGGIAGRANFTLQFNTEGFSVIAVFIRNCYSSANVSGGHLLGGVVGNVNGGVLIQNCYSTGNISGDAELGGIAGRLSREYQLGGVINSFYSTGTVTGLDTLGGVLGFNYSESPISDSDFFGHDMSSLSQISGGYTQSAVMSSKPSALAGGFIGSVIGTSTIGFSNYYPQSTNTLPDVGAGRSITLDIESITEGALKALDETSSSWEADNWNFGTTSTLPTLRSYKQDNDGTQVEGDILCHQQDGRLPCTPTLNFYVVQHTNIAGVHREIGGGRLFAQTTNATESFSFTYRVEGNGLTEPLAYTSSNSTFNLSVIGGSLTPVAGRLNALIQVDLTIPSANVARYSTTLTHTTPRGEDLVIELLVDVEKDAPRLALSSGSATFDMDQAPAYVYDFGNVAASTTVTFNYLTNSASLDSRQPLFARLSGPDASAFSATPDITTAVPVTLLGSIAQTHSSPVITFTGTASRTYRATITYEGAGLSAPITLDLSATIVLPPSLVLTPVENGPPFAGTAPSLSYDITPEKLNEPVALNYIVRGENLLGPISISSNNPNFNITLVTGTLLPIDGALQATISVALTPTAATAYTAAISHSTELATVQLTLGVDASGLTVDPDPDPDPTDLVFGTTTPTSGPQVYPNPVENNLFIQQIGSATVRILAVQGSEVGYYELDGDAAIDCSSFPPGLYIVQVRTADRVYNNRIIKR